MQFDKLALATMALLSACQLPIDAQSAAALPQTQSPDRSEGPVVSVKCDNRIGDAAKLNHVISLSHPGDRIQIHGTCLVDKTIVLEGDRSYLGDSRTGTVMMQAPGTNLAALVASDSWADNSTYTGDPIRIAHMTLDGNSSNNMLTSALVVRSWLTVIEDLQIENAPEDGLQLTSVSANGTPLSNTQVNGRISNCFITNSNGNGVHIVDPGNSVTDWSLLDNWVAASGKSAISMDNAAGWTIRGNHVYAIQQNAIYANRCYGTSIDGNYIEDFGDAGGATWYGIACTVQGDAASVISDNKVFQLNGEPSSGNFVYIGIPQVNYGTGVINVVDNVIRGANGSHDTGLSYQKGGGAGLLVLSADNHVQSAAMPRAVGAGVTLVSGL